MLKRAETVLGRITSQVRAVKLAGGTLYVTVKSASYKDQLKFVAEEILEALRASGVAVERLRVMKVTEEAAVELTAEDVRRCEERAAKITDDELRRTVLETLISQARQTKERMAQGWHKCRKCEALCEAGEILCATCLIVEREAMVKELFKIFYDEPQLRTSEAQRLLVERMPHMRRECTPACVESARTSLIQKVAGSVKIGDEESPEVLKLVMLAKRLPPEKITPAIIRRTLIDLQFNLAEQPKVNRYMSKIRRKV